MKRIMRIILILASAAALVSLGVPNAFAAAPTITSFSPTSGPAGCVVVITGTAFADFPTAEVEFVSPTNVATLATDTVIISDTELLAAVPAELTAGTAYNIRVTNPGGTSTSTGTFLVTEGAGGCAPTITSFTPTSGIAGISVTITGTNFAGATSVTFNGTAANFTVDSSTQITATVPEGVTTGPIAVTTPSGTATSATDFTAVVSGGPTTQVFTNTEPETCAVVGTDGETAMPTPVTVGALSRLLVYFTSERSGFDTHTELLLTFEVLAGDRVVASTPFEWGELGVALRGHTSGTVMWTFHDISPGDYRVRVGARVDPLPGSLGGSHPTAVLENCALTVFAVSGAS